MSRPRAEDPAARPPSVERLLGSVRARVAGRERSAVVAAARMIVAEERRRLGTESGTGGPARSLQALGDELVALLDSYEDAGAGPTPVVNATGVILHTNLGRAPWPAAAIRAASSAAAGYSLLELDAASGRRGPRYPAVQEHLVALTGAEDTLVTNNNATAVALAVSLAGRGGVLVSRGELVEIGGGVRVPEIVRRAGGRLIEVGTTNRTRLADFEAPLAEGRGRLILRVHRSNFEMSGFVEEPDRAELAALAHRHSALVADDLGSGALIDTEPFGLAHEPTPAERLATGADVVTFSGDKLVGGPQAGIVVGRRELVSRMRRDPLARATRPDKAVLAALGATLGLYRSGRALSEIPVWRMIALAREDLRARAVALCARLDHPAASAVPLESTVGGGSLPGDVLPSFGIALDVPSADAAAALLRTGRPAVIGRVAGGRLILDLRTVDPADDETIAQALTRLLATLPAPPSP